MSRPRTLTRVALLFVMALVVFAARQAPAVSAAPPTELFISEYLESTPGNRKAIEIYNGTGSAITLTGTYNVVLYANGSSTPASPINLTGSIAAGGVFLLAHTDTPAAYPSVTFNQTSGSLTFNGNDAVALRNGTTIIDVIGQIGNDPGAGGWGTDPANTTDNTISRKSTICAGDTNGTDAFDPATEWDGFANGTISGLGSHTANCGGGDTAPTVTGTSPVDNATNQAANVPITVTFSETVTISGTVTIVGSSSGTQNVTPTTSDNLTFSLPHTDFANGETVTVTVDDAQVTDQDAIDPPDNMAADYVFGFTIVAPASVCGDPATPIHDIQGNGAASPLVGQTKTIEGVVIGDLQDYTVDPPNELSGYFLQEENAQVDADPNTSEGIFVFDGQNPATNVAMGDTVRVTGTVIEFGDAPDTYTELTGPLTVLVCAGPSGAVSATTINLPVAALSDYEKYESMAVTFPQELTVSEVFTLGRFGEVLLAAGGRLWTPTHEAEPGAPAAAVEAANILRSIILDDALTNQNPDPVIYPAPGLSAFNTLRGGDTTTGLTGVMHYLDTTEDFRIQPTGTVTWNHENPRPTDAPAVSGDLKVVGSNTLNYFTTVDNGPDVCGPAADQDCRGADSPQEFTRQHDKLINMLVELDADIVGLNELENNAAASPANDDNDPVLESIVNALNAALGAGTYDFIDTGVIGTDAIKVGMIYKPASVTPVGPFSILTSSYDPAFIDTRNRPVLAQTFEDNNGAVFTVAAAHLKSKGSGCGAGDDQPDAGGGNCNGTRTAAAEVMVDWFAESSVNNGDPDILLVGDLNSYAKEDPIDVFLNAGYVDLAATLDEPYSYVFDGEWGYLDYAMASPTMASQVAGVAEWHINADEPIVLDYNTEFKNAGQIASFYDDDPFRVSDHDPILVGLNLTPPPDTTPPTVTINQADGQADPTSASPIDFTVVFTETVTGFATGDVTLSGTAGATTATVTEVAPNDGTTYNVAVSGMTGSGTVIATVGAGVAQDGASNGNTASTSTDNSVTYVVPVAPTEIYVSTEAAGTVGALSYGSEDILKWDGSAWSVWFDGSAAGLEAKNAKHNINAFYIPETGDEVLITFAQNARIVPGISGKVDGMDIVRWDGSAFSLLFDGQDVGLTVLTQEKIDGLHELDPSLAPAAVQAAAGGSCQAYFLISSAGNGKVTNYDGTQLKISGEDVLGFCATQLGSTTAGKWHKLLDGKAEGVKPNAITSISASDDGQTLYFTTKAAFNVDSASGGHSMVYRYDMATGQFSGPYFSAPANGLSGKVDGLHVTGDLP